MCAGLATLQRLDDGRVYRQLESLGQRLESALRSAPHIVLQRVGSIFWLLVSPQGKPAAASSAIRSLHGLPSDAAASFAPLFHRLLGEGIYLAPSAFEVGFLCAAHTEADIERLAQALSSA
jgi:glutamate-1-semialdehyde 2,1-aminomutase